MWSSVVAAFCNFFLSYRIDMALWWQDREENIFHFFLYVNHMSYLLSCDCFHSLGMFLKNGNNNRIPHSHSFRENPQTFAASIGKSKNWQKPHFEMQFLRRINRFRGEKKTNASIVHKIDAIPMCHSIVCIKYLIKL